MFFHNFKYTIKTLFKKKALIFWTYAFPIVLGTLFFFAFSNIEKGEMLDIINIAIVENDSFKNDDVYRETFKSLGDKKNDDRIFNIKYTNEKDAKKLLEDEKIDGYFIIKEKPNIYIKENGINQTVFKSVVDEINTSKKMVETLSEEKIKNEIIKGKTINYEKIYSDIINKITNYKSNIKDISKSNLNYTMVEFYTLIAMSALYGGMMSMTAINGVLPNMTSIGKRVQTSKISKFSLIISSMLAAYVVQIIGLIILMLYSIFALKINFGDNIPNIILLAGAGSLAGLSIGIFVSSVFKTKEDTKTGILLAFTMLGCFLSGMMGPQVKYMIDKSVPFANKFNPAAMITDGFYSLYYYDTLDRFNTNLISLLLFSLILILISLKSLRRQKYDSI